MSGGHSIESPVDSPSPALDLAPSSNMAAAAVFTSPAAHTTALPRPLSASIFLPAPSPRRTTVRSQRPQLSLNTVNPARTLGRGNTSLRLNPVTCSPTTRNTFNNAYEPSSARISTPNTFFTPTESEASRPTSSQSNLSSDSEPDASAAPYTLPLCTRSVLRNGPIARNASFYTPMTSLATPGQRRPFFPKVKHVTFRPQLEDAIVNQRYTACHSDLLTEEEWTSRRRADGEKWRAPRTGEKRPSPVDDADEDDGSSSGASSEEEHEPRTPTAGRSKRRREWKWTIGDEAEAEAEMDSE